MQTIDNLRDTLLAMDGRSYPAYKRLVGQYQGAGYVLCVDAVQGDPFAEPSRLRLCIAAEEVELPEWLSDSRLRRVAASDYINRVCYAALRHDERRLGSGKSGVIDILRPGQEVLERTSVLCDAAGGLELRLRVGLPAQGRRVLGRQAVVLMERLAGLTQQVRYAALDAEALRRHVEVVEDSQALREQLAERELLAFVPDGAILPRRSGVDERPLAQGAVPFVSPEALRVTLRAPHAGEVVGMGMRPGVTLIVGGGYHGKSTLLRALERGVYDHIPDDGRACLVTCAAAVKVRAEDGRSVMGTDISNFIDDLPGGQSTQHFVSENASGSTSQAAAIVEALEVGATCLLLDEDTCATNFMIRDARMQALVARKSEPITPFIDRVRQLYEERGVSTIVVVGGAGDYFDVADCVVEMQAYVARDRSADAAAIVQAQPSGRAALQSAWRVLSKRRPLLTALQLGHGRKRLRIRVRGTAQLQLGDEEIALQAMEQLVEPAQVRAIAQAIAYLQQQSSSAEVSWAGLLAGVMQAMDSAGLDGIQQRPAGDLAAFRVFELAAVLARLRMLRCHRMDDVPAG